MSSILNEIADYKRQWVATCKENISEQTLIERAKQYTPHDFTAALSGRISQKKNAVIAEVKKASPSKGMIREDFDPVWIANSYASAGAACLSVLTDVKYFQGADDYVRAIRKEVNVPILRKEFIVDPYQIVEAREMGADAILIILAMVDDVLASELAQTASELGLSVLPEVHNAEELERALKLDTELIGINNRDLHNFETSLQTTLSLLTDIPEGHTVITESGIFTTGDIEQMNQAGIYGFLIGESLMRQPVPGDALKALLK